MQPLHISPKVLEEGGSPYTRPSLDFLETCGIGKRVGCAGTAHGPCEVVYKKFHTLGLKKNSTTTFPVILKLTYLLLVLP